MAKEVTRLTLISLLAVGLLAQAQNVDPTGGSSRLFDSINGGAQRAAQFGANSGGSGGGALPQSRYGSVSSSATNNSNSGSTYSNPSGGVGQNNNPQVRTPNFHSQSPQGGNTGGGGLNDLASVLAKVNNNPQIMQLLQKALASGNQQQIQSMIQLINNFSGGSGNSGNQGPIQGHQNPNKPTVAPHCAAPKYNTIMSAVKNVSFKFERELMPTQAGSVGGTSQISYVYYKKKEETNYFEYKLVFKFQTGPVVRFTYFHFTIPKSFSNGVRFSTYFTTSNENLLTQIIRETDFASSNVISCGDLKSVYNGGGGGPRFTSAFSAQTSVPGFAAPAQNNFQQPRGFQQPQVFQQPGGFQQAGGFQQQQQFGFQQQQQFGMQQGFGGMNQMGAFNPFGAQQQQQQPQGQSFGAPANSGGAFIFNN